MKSFERFLIEDQSTGHNKDLYINIAHISSFSTNTGEITLISGTKLRAQVELNISAFMCLKDMSK